jgi:exonuclease-1
MLIDSNVKPILVFDGANLQMKEKTELERAKHRQESKAKAEDFLKNGNSVMAHKMFASALDISPEMAYEFAQAAVAKGVECIVAPYEADA